MISQLRQTVGCILGMVLLLLSCSTPAEATNHIRVVYGEARSVEHNQTRMALVKQKYLEDFASGLESLQFPGTLTLASAQCGKPSANYSSQTKTITLCYELMLMIANKLDEQYEYPRDQVKGSRTFYGALSFILFHEFGHALIDLYGIRTMGREEDVADQMAAAVILESSANPRVRSEAIDIMEIDGALWFFEFSKKAISESSFSDEHSLNQQRYYNLICWAYGKDSIRYGYLEGHLKRERARRCGDEYRQLHEGFLIMMRQYIPQEAPRSGTQSSRAAASNSPPFQPQANQRYNHPVYSELSISVDFRMILVNGLPPPYNGLPMPIELSSLPNNQWVQLRTPREEPLPISVMRDGYNVMIRWLP